MSSSSEWMKVMLEEIARKKTEAERERLEAERRCVEQDPAAGGHAPGRTDDSA